MEKIFLNVNIISIIAGIVLFLFRIKLPADSANMGIKINQKAVSLPVVDGMLKVELQAEDQLVLMF